MASKILTGALCFIGMLAAAHGAVCGDLMQGGICQQKLMGMSQAQQGDMKRMCSLMADAKECVESAIANCRESGIDQPGMDAALKPFEMLAAACPESGTSGSSSNNAGNTGSGNTGSGNAGMGGNSGGEIPETVTCMEAMKCASRGQELEDYYKKKDMEKACPLAKKMLTCTKSAYDDCIKMLPAEQAEQMGSGYEMGLKEYNKKCGDGASAISQTTLFLTVFSALAIIVARLL